MAVEPSRRPPRSSALSNEFSEAEAFGSGLPPAGGRAGFLQSAGGRPFAGRVTRIPLLHQTALAIARLDVATLSHGEADPSRTVILVPLEAPGRCLWNGHRMAAGSALALGPGAEHYGANPRELRFALASVHTRAFEASYAAITRREWTLRRGGVRAVGRSDNPSARLHAVLRRIAAGAGGRPAPLPARRAAEQALLVEFAHAFDAADAPRPGAGTRVDRARVLRRVQAYLEDHSDEPIYLADLCAAARVSERTLENVFHVSFGLTPVRYLKLRRLHGARRALGRIEHGPGAVARTALDCGFWHFGHFAADYQALFGEHPSDTLRRSRA